jgi:hypothetical protein
MSGTIAETVDVAAPAVVIEATATSKKEESSKAVEKDEKEAKPDASVKRFTEEEVDEDKEERISLSKSAFDKRIKQAARAMMREQFGTEDATEIKKSLGEHASLKAKADEERRKKLDEIERLKEDLKASGESKAEIARELAELRERHVVDETEREIVGAANKHVADEFLDFASFEFGKYVRTLDADEIEKLTDKAIGKWFEAFGAKHPQMARVVVAAPEVVKEEPKVEVKTVPITTGAQKPRGEVVGSDHLAGKTPKPGLPNSMTAAELKSYKAAHGYTF